MIELLAWGADGWGDELAAGALLTVQLAFATLPFGLVLGFLVALAKNGERRWLAAAGNLFTTIFRGLPELLTLLIVFYGGQILVQKLVRLVAPDAYVEINAFLAGMFALGLVFAAFSSEVFLAALRAVPKGQVEAARALGLRHRQALRLVVVPQLWRIALPGLGNLWLVLLKDTALVSVIALPDLMRNTGIAVGVTKEPFLFYGVACLVYLAFSVVSGVVLSALENRSNRGIGRARA